MQREGGQERMRKALTVKWNRDRGLLDTFNPGLEVSMLSEEAKEFYNAETLSHMLAEYADFIFVLDGTQAKFGSYIAESYSDQINIFRKYKEILEWANVVLLDMQEHLCSMLGENYNEVSGLIKMASSFVVSCNNLKGTKKENGKVVKNTDHADPAVLIQEELDRLGF